MRGIRVAEAKRKGKGRMGKTMLFSIWSNRYRK